MNPKRRENIRLRHHQVDDGMVNPFCHECFEPWPCDMIELLDSYEAILKTVDIVVGSSVEGL